MNMLRSSLRSCIDDKAALLEKINELMPIRENERKQNGEVMTPLQLVNQMLDKLPTSVWSDPTLRWLDPASDLATFQYACIND